MGLRDHFGRRERESAVAPGEVEAIEREMVREDREGADPPEPPGSGDPTAGEGDSILLPGADAAELRGMLSRAMQTGTAQVSTSSHEVRSADEVRTEVLGLLARAGAAVRSDEADAGSAATDRDSD